MVSSDTGVHFKHLFHCQVQVWENVFRVWVWSNGNNCKWVETWYKFAKFIVAENHNFTNLQKYSNVKVSRYTVYGITEYVMSNWINLWSFKSSISWVTLIAKGAAPIKLSSWNYSLVYSISATWWVMGIVWVNCHSGLSEI